MKSFQEFTKSRKYIVVEYDQNSQELLRNWAMTNGFDLSVKYNGEKQDPEDFDFHTTIFYSTNEVNMRNQAIYQSPTEVIITGIKFLGENKDIPVLTISNFGGIMSLRQYYEDLGLEDQWPSYQPHISLSYAKQAVDTKNINLPTFRPKFNKIMVKNIED
jgi:2'-5' RNA ligase